MLKVPIYGVYICHSMQSAAEKTNSLSVNDRLSLTIRLRSSTEDEVAAG